MTQITKKFLQTNAVDETKIRLSNDAYLKARNAADSADVSILKVSSSDILTFFSVPEVGADPTSSNGLVRKSYVDNLMQGLKWKDSARAATTANITLSGAQTIDGVSVIAGDRVLVKNQTTASENGIYVAAAGAWSRSLDADAGTELVSAAIFIEEGTANATKGFVCTTISPITVGTTSISFAQFTSAGSYSAGNGISIIGSTIAVSLDATAGLEFNSAALRVKVNAAGAVLRGSSGLAVNVDAATIKINASNQLEGIKQSLETFTLSGTDITNQYIDLARIASFSEGVSFLVAGGPEQLNAIDYTVSLTGGAGGNTRISFISDLATGGSSELISGDVLVIKYMYI